MVYLFYFFFKLREHSHKCFEATSPIFITLHRTKMWIKADRFSVENGSKELAWTGQVTETQDGRTEIEIHEMNACKEKQDRARSCSRQERDRSFWTFWTPCGNIYHITLWLVFIAHPTPPHPHTPIRTPGTGPHVLLSFAHLLHWAKALAHGGWSQVFAGNVKWFMNKDVLARNEGWKARKERRELTFIKRPYVSKRELGTLLL